MYLNDDQVHPLLSLYEEGQYLKAFQAGLEFGPLNEWRGPRGRIMASRLSVNLGAPRMSRCHRLMAWRETPSDAEVLYYYGFTLLEMRGPLEAWRFFNQQSFPSTADADLTSSWHTLSAQILILLRDFDRAEESLRRAEEIAPANPWVHVNWSSCFEEQDRYDDALAAVNRALEHRSWYRPAVQAKGHLLPLLGQDQEAYEFLKQATHQIECSAIHFQLAAILLERESYDELREAVNDIDRLCPLMEKGFAKSLASLRSLIAYRLGDLDAAIEFARQSEDKFESKLADRLADPARRTRRRVRLPVGFVRQHHRTCVPATLSSISQFWSMPAEHLQIAEAICYDGTTSYNERHWADEHGWSTREFTLTEDSAEQLIDAGIPFTLTTTNPGSGHLQAVIGYDGMRGTVIIRDPYQRHWYEGFTDGLMEHYAAFGPRGMAMVPVAERARLEALDLPDAALWDRLHELDGALETHRRKEAETAFGIMRDSAPDHRLTIEAERRLMIYDANSTGMLATVDRLLAKYPKDSVLQLSRLSLLRELGRREERLEMLERECERNDVHPSFVSQFAQELAADARDHERALKLLRRAIRQNPMDAGNYYILAGIACDQLKFDDALELYRIAACLEYKNEAITESFFRMAQHRKQTDQALEWLRRRVERFGRQSSQPIRTLDWALRRLNRDLEAQASLADAIKSRPTDGELLLYAAEIEASTSLSRIEQAKQLCQQAEPYVSKSQWLRVKARLASYECQLPEALRIWREIAEMQPLASDAHRAIANLLAETESKAAAREYLRAVVDRFPHYQPLLVLWIEWLREEPPEASEAVIRRLIELNPADAWAHRELGFLLIKMGRLDDAAHEAELAGQLDPTHSSWHHLRGELFQAQGRLADARHEYRAALKLSVDNDFAIRELIYCCETAEQKRQELEFIRSELAQQVIYGDGLLSYRQHASQLLDSRELLTLLQEALAARPDLWHAWSACIRQLTDLNELDEAMELAIQATDRFPLLPRIWLDRARVCQMRRDFEGELAAAQAGYEINPQWTEVARQLADLYLRKGDFAKSAEVLRRAIADNPLEGINYGWLADVQWKVGEQEEALQSIERAVQLAPNYSWAWDCLRRWSADVEQPERPLRVAREITQQRPGEVEPWLNLARLLSGQQEPLEEQLSAIDRALALDPRSVDAHELRVGLLQKAGKTEEALAACRPPIFGDHVPADLLASAAWIRWETGHPQEAVDQLRSITAADPSFYKGWQWLADWLGELDDHEGALEASSHLVRLNPHVDSAVGQYAIALLGADKRAEAKDAFRHAFDLNPSYQYAGLWLFDLQVEADELQDARQTLASLEAHCPGAFTVSKRAILACRQSQRETARSAFLELCLSDEESPWPLRAAYDAMKTAHWVSDVRNIIGNAITEKTLNSEAGPRWVHSHVDDNLWRLDSRVRFLLKNHPRAGGLAIHEWVSVLLQANRKRKLQRFTRNNWKWLQTEPMAWGSIGWGLTSIKNYGMAFSWMKNWREQPKAESWMLVNAVEAYREQGLRDEAAEISRHAVTLAPDGGIPLHRLWLAADAVSAEEYVTAAEILAEVDPTSLDEDYSFLYQIVQSVLEIVSAAADDRARVFQGVRERFQSLAQYKNMGVERARRKFYRQSLKRIASTVGGFGATFWQLKLTARSFLRGSVK